jgi:hypothetical protein
MSVGRKDLWVPENRIRVVIGSPTPLGDGFKEGREIASPSRWQLLFAKIRART